MTPVQRAVPLGFQVIDHNFVTVVIAWSAYSAVLSATPPGLPGVSLIVQLQSPCPPLRKSGIVYNWRILILDPSDCCSTIGSVITLSSP